MANDKDIDSVLKILPKNAVYYFTKASIERALNEDLIKEQASIYQLLGSSHPTVSEAIEAAIENADNDDLIFIGGSSFIVADALPIFL
jgi:dihydrofolate synthase/folylpolyglutamate synthase